MKEKNETFRQQLNRIGWLKGIEGETANVCKTNWLKRRDKIFANFVCKSLKMSEVAA